MLKLDSIAAFVAVADAPSITEAARRLGLAKSVVSERLMELERLLGTQLLQRTTRKLSLTAVGEVYYRHCVAMCDEARAADDAVAQAQSEPRGTIHVTCPVTLAQTVLGPILPQFLARHPQVRLDMEVSNRVVDLVQDGVDVALRVRPSTADSGSLVVKHLGTTQSLLVASPALLERQQRPAVPDDLARLDTVAMSASDGRMSWKLLGPGGAEHLFQHQPRFVADDLLTLKFAVLAAVGFCILPDYMCRDELQDGRLISVLPGWEPPPAVVHAVFPSRRGLLPAVRTFLDFLGDNLPGR